jgi:hypothetical protein
MAGLSRSYAKVAVAEFFLIWTERKVPTQSTTGNAAAMTIEASTPTAESWALRCLKS